MKHYENDTVLELKIKLRFKEKINKIIILLGYVNWIILNAIKYYHNNVYDRNDSS